MLILLPPSERKSKINFSHYTETVPLPGWKLSEAQIKEINGWKEAYEKELNAKMFPLYQGKNVIFGANI